MMKILHVSCSPRGQAAESYGLSKKIIDFLRQKEPTAIPVSRVIGGGAISHVDENYALAQLSATAEISQEGSIATSDELIQELERARALGRALGQAGITVVYGGTTKGLMRVVADAALASGGNVHGVITESLHQRGQSHSGLTRHEIALTLRSRKERMAELADAFIALPGGIGTIEELMEVWTMNLLSEFDKPVGLLNFAGFFTAFLGFIDHMVDTKFLPAAHRHSISVDADAGALIEKLHSYTRVDVPKWL